VNTSEKQARKRRANAIRILSMDAVQAANSGHPGMPMGMADIAEVLWHDFLQHDPTDPNWQNRDRFVLSNGHGSMLLYAVLHLTGYALSLSDLKAFRQLHSNTPGHPEKGETPGVETTTGPLGQGLGHAVGMALGAQLLANAYNRSNFKIIDHDVYCFVGDGCLMEGISHEVASMAGTLGLGRLITFWDNNHISIDGTVDEWFADDTPARFRAYGWHVIDNIDGHDPEQVQAAILLAKNVKDKPSLLCCRTTIGWGSPKMAGKAESHGAPLGAAEIAATRQALGWTDTTPFNIPTELYTEWDARPKGANAKKAWNALWAAYQAAHPDLAANLAQRWQGDLPQEWHQDLDRLLKEWQVSKPTVATRKASQQVLACLINRVPALLGGSADLSESTLTLCPSLHRVIHPQTLNGNYLHYGVREFGMNAMMCGLALYGGFIPYGGTFLTFLDYGRNAVRLAAMMQQRVIFVYSHDSIGLGEDGPTHQPIEHIGMLRLTPGLMVWRPADATETAVAWGEALKTLGPTALLLTRQACPALPQLENQTPDIQKGAYRLWESTDKPIVALLMATGSEVALALNAGKALDAKGYGVRVISMPCWEKFESQPEAYREEIMPHNIQARTYVEASASAGLMRWVGLSGKVVGLNQYGLSAPGAQVFAELGITTEAVVNATLAQLEASQQTS
jgi:transketolase